MNGVPTSIVQILGQYYKAILLPFEEWNRKNAQQRSMLGMQGQAGQSVPGGQHGMAGQMPGGDPASQGVIPPTVPPLDGGGSALPPHHPFSSSSQAQRQQQPSVGLTMLPGGRPLQSPDLMSGMSSNNSQPFLSQTSPSDGSQLSVHGQAQDGAAPPLDSDAEGRKRKGTAEADVKRVRQRTGLSIIYPNKQSFND